MPTPPTIHFGHESIGLTNGVYAVIDGVTIAKQHPALEELKQNVAQEILASEGDVKEHDIAQGYRELLTEYNVQGVVHSGENWIRLIKKRGSFFTINTAVDAYNVVVAQSCLGFGAHDLDAITGDIQFDFAQAGETILPVNATKAYDTNEGDFVYRDDEKILAWLDVRDCDAAKITLDTKRIILIVEGNRRTPQEYNHQHLEHACQLITQFCGGEYQLFVLEAENDSARRLRSVSTEVAG